MSESLRVRLTHALLAVLLTAGVLLPLMTLLEPSLITPRLLLLAVAVLLLFELACLNRVTALVSLGLSLTGLLVWLFAMDGLLTVSDIVLAASLRLSGIRSALPLVASSAAVMLTVTVTLICCFAVLRNVSVLPAFLLCFGMILVIYLSGRNDAIPLFLPALLALVLLLLTDRFPETSVFPLLPAAAVLIAGAFLLSGGGMDDAPFREKADDLRQAILDRLLFTQPRDVFSLSSEGYDPLGRDQLGGKPDPSDHVVMQVSTPRAVYLRGVILNDYTGRGWRNTTGGRRYLRQSLSADTRRAALFDEDLPPVMVRNALCDPFTISVRMLSSSASTLFVPQRVRTLDPGGNLVPYYADSSELFITRNLKSGDTYSVSAPLFTAGDPGLGTLIEVCSTLEDSRYDALCDVYTALPGHLEEPVYALAREAASVAVSPYDRALALQSWLSRTFRYTLDVVTPPQNVDFVTHFLLDTREGYCTYFASAMTVLCRMIGLPARYVEGYLAEPDENGEALVTGLSAHAWTEVYFKGFGWLTFDATPRRAGSGSPDADPSAPPDSSNALPESSPPAGSSDTPSPEPDAPEKPDSIPSPQEESVTPVVPEEDKDSETAPSDADASTPVPEEGVPAPENDPASSPSLPWLWLLLLLLLVAFLLRVLFTSPSFRDRRAKTPKERFDVWTQEITDLLRAEGLTRAVGETPMAFGRRVDLAGLFTVSIGPVGECVSLLRYSRATAGETDIGLVRDSCILLRSELSRPARLRCFFSRVFIPRSRRDSL